MEKNKQSYEIKQSYVNFLNLEKHLKELVDVKTQINIILGEDRGFGRFAELMETKDFSNLQNRYNSLVRNIQDYYKSRLNLEFSRYGEVGVKKLLNEIIRFELNKDKNIAEHTEFISYHLKTFVKKLIENK